jgi:hypothetical protein
VPWVVQDVPCLDVRVGILLADERNPQRAYDRNDTRDLAWLALVIPYASIVAGEKHWFHVSHPFGRKYGTALTSSPAELLSLLQQTGCLQAETDQ